MIQPVLPIFSKKFQSRKDAFLYQTGAKDAFGCIGLSGQYYTKLREENNWWIVELHEYDEEFTSDVPTDGF